MDHLVMDLRAGDGTPLAYLTLYDLALMPEVGIGHVVLLRVRAPELAVDIALCDDREVGARMQDRLRGIVATTNVSRGLGTDLDLVPELGDFRRVAGEGGELGYRVVGGGHEIEAWWSEPEEPFWMSADAGVFHPTRAYSGTMIAFQGAGLHVDGKAVSGAPTQDPWWEPRLGRPFSSAHAALGEVALDVGQPVGGG